MFSITVSHIPWDKKKKRGSMQALVDIKTLWRVIMRRVLDTVELLVARHQTVHSQQASPNRVPQDYYGLQWLRALSTSGLSLACPWLRRSCCSRLEIGSCAQRTPCEHAISGLTRASRFMAVRATWASVPRAKTRIQRVEITRVRVSEASVMSCY